MYTRPKRIYTNLKNLENYIEGDDIYNSLLLLFLQDPQLETENYEVSTSYRTDIIAEDFYGDLLYEPFVILQLKSPINSITRGKTLNLIKKSEIDRILNKLD